MKTLHTTLAVFLFAACAVQAAETTDRGKGAGGMVSIEPAKMDHAEMDRAKPTLPVLSIGKSATAGTDCLKEARTDRMASLEN